MEIKFPFQGLPGLARVIYTRTLPKTRRFNQEQEIFNAETHISTQQAQALEKARVPDSHED